MSRDRDNLLRGQGLFKQTIAGLAARWRGYAWTVAGSAGLGAFLLSSRNTPSEQWTCAYQHWQGVAVSWFASGRSDPAITVHLRERTARVPSSVLANDPIWVWCWDDLVGKLILGGTLGALVGMLLCFGFAIWIRSEGKESTRDRFITGTQIVAERVLARKTRKATNSRSIRIASVGIPAWLECRHFALLGTTGAGKTTVMRQMLDQVEARGEPALVYDTSGEFITQYYRPERGDIILNPFDERSAFWSPFSEIAHPADADRIARQLVSETGERDDDVWLETSRILVANILRVLSAEGRTTLPDLLDALQVKGKEEMKVWLAGTSSLEAYDHNPIRTSYELLWNEVRNPERSNITIQNTLRRILENYFTILGNRDKDDIIDRFDGRDKQVCASLYAWVNDGSHSAYDDCYVSPNEGQVERYLTVFKRIFEETGHIAHYNMMLGVEDTDEAIVGDVGIIAVAAN